MISAITAPRAKWSASCRFDIWRAVLKKDHIGITDNFFALGATIQSAVCKSSRGRAKAGLAFDACAGSGRRDDRTSSATHAADGGGRECTRAPRR